MIDGSVYKKFTFSIEEELKALFLKLLSDKKITEEDGHVEVQLHLEFPQFPLHRLSSSFDLLSL